MHQSGTHACHWALNAPDVDLLTNSMFDRFLILLCHDGHRIIILQSFLNGCIISNFSQERMWINYMLLMLRPRRYSCVLGPAALATELPVFDGEPYFHFLYRIDPRPLRHAWRGLHFQTFILIKL